MSNPKVFLIVFAVVAVVVDPSPLPLKFGLNWVRNRILIAVFPTAPTMSAVGKEPHLFFFIFFLLLQQGTSI